ncbi:MAG: response regulator [Thermodesulfobacteriota bacterium]
MGAGGRNILIVDDNPEFVDLVRKILKHKEFSLSVAMDGKTAIEKALSERPELVLLDLKLPDISGEEVLKRLRDIDRNMAVVIVTGFGGEQVAVDLMRKGAIDFISKPIDHDAFLRSVENALEIRDSQIENRCSDLYSSLERFFPFLAHEIRNPLHAISGALAIIRKRSDLKDELLKQSISIIDDEVQHLNNFVQECLNFVRPPNIVRFTEIDLNEVASIVVSIVSHIYDLRSQNIKITLIQDPNLPKIYANYEEVKQVFLNIIRNAFEAMPEGGELRIQTAQIQDNSKYVEVLFIDNGVGISQDKKAYLFQPFFTTKQRGTGLGLALCRKIIEERHHGKIEIESEENRGTLVRIELPIGRRVGER